MKISQFVKIFGIRRVNRVTFKKSYFGYLECSNLGSHNPCYFCMGCTALGERLWGCSSLWTSQLGHNPKIEFFSRNDTFGYNSCTLNGSKLEMKLWFRGQSFLKWPIEYRQIGANIEFFRSPQIHPL